MIIGQKYFGICVCLILVFALSGCKPGMTIHAKKIAVVNANFDIRLSLTNQTSFTSAIQSMALAPPPDLTKDRLTTDEKLFIFSLFEQIMIFAKNNLGENIQLIDSFYQTTEYQSATEITDSNYIYLYSPPPYRLIDINNKKNIQQLCDSLGVDALMSITLYYRDHLFREILQLPFAPDKERISLTAQLKVINKNGDLINNQQIWIDNDKVLLNLQNAPMTFCLSDYRQNAYQVAATIFLDELKKAVIEVDK